MNLSGSYLQESPSLKGEVGMTLNWCGSEEFTQVYGITPFLISQALFNITLNFVRNQFALEFLETAYYSF